MDKIFCPTKVKISNGDENFVRRKICPTKFSPIRYYYLLYKLAISVGIELESKSIVVITEKKGNIYAHILNVF